VKGRRLTIEQPCRRQDPRPGIRTDDLQAAACQIANLSSRCTFGMGAVAIAGHYDQHVNGTRIRRVRRDQQPTGGSYRRVACRLDLPAEIRLSPIADSAK
jgi:hypothetical protein